MINTHPVSGKAGLAPCLPMRKSHPLSVDDLATLVE